MVVPTIALYASPPSGVCSASHQITAPYDFDHLGSRSSPSSPPPPPSQSKQIAGGLSSLFSSPHPVRHVTSASFCEELGSVWHDEMKELSSSFCCYSSATKFGVSSYSSKRDQSPVSVFQAPVSGGTCCSLRNGREGDLGFQSSIRIGSNGLFRRIVRSALGSCIDYDSPSSDVHGNGLEKSSPLPIGVDELTFNMEDTFLELNCMPHAKDLLAGAQLRHEIFREDFVIKAFYEAEKAHRGQVRASGDPYLQHCVETAVLLALIGASSTVVAAGLLHDTLDDSFVSYDYIFRTFGAGVADLVEGVSKLSHLSKLARENDTANKTDEANRLHTMFLAMADARAVLIKLADRLHNMMTLDALPLAKRKRFAKETLEIFAPLANRLGISSWKERLENLCFKHLNPDQYEELSSKLVESLDEAMITPAKLRLEGALRDKGIAYHVVSGRHKSLYSIYRKMLSKKLTMNEIHDIHGLRLIVENDEDCYRALDVVHQLWTEVPGKFKDYITHPKFNGYQSLHTVVKDKGMVPLEVQIRTKEMHLQAEYGFAAHWRYKEGDSQHSYYILQMVEWARWVISWQCQTISDDQSCIGYIDSMKPPCKFPSHSEDCPYSYKAHCGEDGPLFIIMIENDKMSVQELPANSSIKTLLERIGRGSSRWVPYRFPIKEELRPRLNSEPVSDPTCKLKMGDVVELTPRIPDESLTEYREEFQRMYDRDLIVRSGGGSAKVAGRRS